VPGGRLLLGQRQRLPAKPPLRAHRGSPDPRRGGRRRHAGRRGLGGRSPDIVVAGGGINPPVAYTDLADPAPGDLLSAGENRLFVRVHNRGATRESAAVDLYFAPADAPWTWPDPAHRIAAAAPVADIDPGSFGYTAEILWTPSPGPPGYVLVALARPSDAPLPDLPGTGAPPDLADFWSWFLVGGPGRSAGMRAVRFAS